MNPYDLAKGTALEKALAAATTMMTIYDNEDEVAGAQSAVNDIEALLLEHETKGMSAFNIIFNVR